MRKGMMKHAPRRVAQFHGVGCAHRNASSNDDTVCAHFAVMLLAPVVPVIYADTLLFPGSSAKPLDPGRMYDCIFVRPVHEDVKENRRGLQSSVKTSPAATDMFLN